MWQSRNEPASHVLWQGLNRVYKEQHPGLSHSSWLLVGTDRFDGTLGQVAVHRFLHRFGFEGNLQDTDLTRGLQQERQSRNKWWRMREETLILGAFLADFLLAFNCSFTSPTISEKTGLKTESISVLCFLALVNLEHTLWGGETHRWGQLEVGLEPPAMVLWNFVRNDERED